MRTPAAFLVKSNSKAGGFDISSPADAIKQGIGFVTEDRKRFGLVLDQTILNNMTLAGLRRISGRFLTSVDAESAAGERSMKELRVKANSVFTIAGTLSGGNQQKVVLAKWLLTNPRVLFLDEPTRGIDVGAKQEIYAQINKLAKSGLAIVLVSSELPEVLGMSDRILVLHEGRITGEFTPRRCYSREGHGLRHRTCATSGIRNSSRRLLLQEHQMSLGIRLVQ